MGNENGDGRHGRVGTGAGGDDRTRDSDATGLDAAVDAVEAAVTELAQPALTTDRKRFFDGGEFPTDRPPETDTSRQNHEADYRLRRVVVRDRELFRLDRRIGFCDDPPFSNQQAPDLTADDRVDGLEEGVYVVPLCKDWNSDLTSVPALFTWLVPKTGKHLPAALIHDGLVREKGQAKSHLGHDVTRDGADRVFRNAMAAAGVGLIRRWLIWSAVTMATILSTQIGADDAPRANARRRWYLSVLVGTGAVILFCAVQATMDVAGLSAEPWYLVELPWMRRDALGWELFGGAVGAIAVPVLLSVFWLPFARACMIGGVAIALVAPVAILALMVTGIYHAVEAIGRVAGGRIVIIGGIVVAVLATLGAGWLTVADLDRELTPTPSTLVCDC